MNWIGLYLVMRSRAASRIINKQRRLGLLSKNKMSTLYWQLLGLHKWQKETGLQREGQLITLDQLQAFVAVAWCWQRAQVKFQLPLNVLGTGVTSQLLSPSLSAFAGEFVWHNIRYCVTVEFHNTQYVTYRHMHWQSESIWQQLPLLVETATVWSAAAALCRHHSFSQVVFGGRIISYCHILCNFVLYLSFSLAAILCHHYS